MVTKRDINGFKRHELEKYGHIFGHDIAARLERVEEQLKQMEAILTLPTLQNECSRQERIAFAIANHVDSVVGLREALTWKHRSLRAVWFILLFLGGAATAYYVYKGTAEYLVKEPATKVSHNREISYAYPPLVFCPPWWFSMSNVRAMGLEMDALKYSLGWLKYTGNDYFGREPPPDLAIARERFLTFYSMNNFTSLLDYFKALSSNISDTESLQDNATLYSQCAGCKYSIPAEKKLFTDVVCYVYHFENATVNSTASPTITLTNHFRADGALKSYRKSWLMDILPNVGIDGPSISLKPFYVYTARITMQRVIMLNSSNKTCVDLVEYPRYSQRSCVEQCLRDQRPSDNLNEIAAKSFVSEISEPRSPEESLNVLDLIAVLQEPAEMSNDTAILNGTLTNFTAAERLLASIPNDTHLYCAINETITTVLMNETIKNDTIKNVSQSGPTGKEVVDCYAQCKPPCDRMIYDMTLERHRDVDEHSGNNRGDVSMISVFLKHAAVSQGGIVTWREVDTMTFSDFVSNVGGTLGLFLGCTLMTLAQLILSLVNLTIHGRRHKIRSYDLHFATGSI